MVVKRKDGVGETVRKEVLDAHMARDSDHEEIVGSAICQLSTRQHQCIVLQKWISLTTNEIGLTLGVAETSVKTHLSHARKRLRELL